MKGGIVEINWHDSKPVLTLDFHPKSGLLATGGGDHDIKLWSLAQCDSRAKVPKVSYISTLTCHGHSVNTLRFSPSGLQIASGADGGELIIWKLHLTGDGESWKMEKRLLHHQKDVLDLQWSADGEYLVSGSVDNLCIVWDANKGCAYQVLDAHLHYVQGVAWDPLGHYVASLSSDRTCRIYAKKMHGKSKGLHKLNYVCQHVVAKSELRKLDDSKAHSAKAHLFHDETLPSFFRRLAWSPDGSFLLVPAGIHKFSSTSETINTAHIFSRKDFSRPAIQLPGANKPIVVIRFCPFLFHLRRPSSASDGFFKLPYRIVFAVATLNSIFLYDTEGIPPIAIFAGLHYAAITDIAWSPDAKYLAVSSRDCFCTIIQFENSELGSPLQSESQISAQESKDHTTSEHEIGSSMGVFNIEAASSADQIANMKVFKSPSTVTGLAKIDKPVKTCIASVSDEAKTTSDGNKALTVSERESGTSMDVDNCEATSATHKSPSTINESAKIDAPGNLHITPVPIESKITSEENKRLTVSKQVVTNKLGKKRITPTAIP